jgi:hypothetical protein
LSKLRKFSTPQPVSDDATPESVLRKSTGQKLPSGW